MKPENDSGMLKRSHWNHFSSSVKYLFRVGVKGCAPRPVPPTPAHRLLEAGLSGAVGRLQAWGLYRCAHGADCELRLGGHDVCGLDVAVVHGVLKCGPDIGVLVASVAIERDFGSSPGNKRGRTDSGVSMRRVRGRQREGREDSEGHSSGKL